MTLMQVESSQLDGILHSIQQASELSDLTEARARIEAARAWAKVHKQVKEMRLDLLRVEIEALVRIVELGGLETLPARDRKAAQHLASLSAGDRATLVAKAGESITTAAGMVRAIWKAQELAKHRQSAYELGLKIASGPDPLDGEELRRYVRESSMRVESVLTKVLDDFGHRSEFTINELADEIIQGAAIGDAAADDPDLIEGVREVCRKAVRSAPTVMVGGTVLPRFITAKSGDAHWVRVPVENATIAHLAQMVETRREQIEADLAKLATLERALSKLRETCNSDSERIGDVIATDLKQSV